MRPERWATAPLRMHATTPRLDAGQPTRPQWLVRITASVALAALAASVAIPGDARAERLSFATPSDKVYRCTMNNGAITFADKPCVGAKQVAAWSPRDHPSGIRRTGSHARASDAPAAQPYRRVDPYVDCQERGGKFRLVSRICVLPSSNTSSATPAVGDRG